MKIFKLTALAGALCALALPTAAQAATPGVNIAGAPTSDRVREALDTGAKTVRIFALWRDFEPHGPNEYPSNEVNLANLTKAYDDAIKQLNAAGAKPLFVVTEAPGWSNGGADSFTPPSDPTHFASFLKRFAEHNKAVGQVAAYEIWNEADEDVYWHPKPSAAQYSAMLKAGYAAIKQGDPTATVLASPTTGNNYGWLEELYNNGAGDSFDAVAVHTDTACLDRGPDQFYRESDGRLARFTFLGYRTVRDTMLSRGQDKPIWMTELGWSSTHGGPNSCTRGTWKGMKPSGVSSAQQAEFLSKAFQCMANDPYVVHASWFTMRDTVGAGIDELNHYGLLGTNGAPKPAYAAFKQVTASPPAAGPCGDFDGPSIRIVKPAPGTQFVDKLDIQAAATDGGVGLGRITFNYNGGTEIRNFTESLANDNPVGLAPWFGSSKLPLGKHTIEVVALDMNGNVSKATVEVEKVATLASTLTPAIKLKQKKITCKGKGKKRSCKLSGSLSRGIPGTPSIGGKIAAEWQYRSTKGKNKGKWIKLIGGMKPANKPFSFTAKPKFKGKWRVRVVYQGLAPWKKTASKWITFTVKK